MRTDPDPHIEVFLAKQPNSLCPRPIGWFVLRVIQLFAVLTLPLLILTQHTFNVGNSVPDGWRTTGGPLGFLFNQSMGVATEPEPEQLRTPWDGNHSMHLSANLPSKAWPDQTKALPETGRTKEDVVSMLRQAWAKQHSTKRWCAEFRSSRASEVEHEHPRQLYLGCSVLFVVQVDLDYMARANRTMSTKDLVEARARVESLLHERADTRTQTYSHDKEGAGRTEPLVVNVSSIDLFVGSIPDESLDMVNFKVRHDHCSIAQDLYACWQKVVEGGVVTGGQYINNSVGSALVAVSGYGRKAVYDIDKCDRGMPGAVGEGVNDFARFNRLNLQTTQDKIPTWVLQKGLVVDQKPRQSTPKILHFIWASAYLKGDNYINTESAAVIDKWQSMHPTWQVMRWDNNLIRNVFPDLATNLSKESIPASIADVLRLAALIKYGGVYIDADTIPLRPINELVERTSPFVHCAFPLRPAGFIYSTSCTAVGNSPIASPPNNPILMAAYRLVSENLQTKRQNSQVLRRTGPVPFSKAVLSTQKNATEAEQFTFLNSNAFNYCAQDSLCMKRHKNTLQKLYGVFGNHISSKSWTWTRRHINFSDPNNHDFIQQDFFR